MTGDELLRWRRRMGWTQVQAAEALDMDSAHFARLERSVLPIRRVMALACRALEWDRRASLRRKRLRKRKMAAA